MVSSAHIVIHVTKMFSLIIELKQTNEIEVLIKVWALQINAGKHLTCLKMSVGSLITVLVAVIFSAESRKVVDLTHTLDKDAPHWPLQLQYETGI